MENFLKIIKLSIKFLQFAALNHHNKIVHINLVDVVHFDIKKIVHFLPKHNGPENLKKVQAKKTREIK